MKKEELEAAEEALEALSVYRLASSCERDGRLSEAEQLFSLLIQRRDEAAKQLHSGAFFHLGRLHDLAGRPAECREAMVRCLRLNASHAEAYRWLADHDGGAPFAENEFWDFVAEYNPLVYIADVDDPEAFQRTGEEDAALIRRHHPIGPGDDILEIGCGMGRILRPLSGACRSIHGVDISAVMIRRARDYLNGLDNVTVQVQQGARLAYADASFSFVYAWLVFMHLPYRDFLAYVAEACRVLKPGGTFFFQAVGDFSPAAGVGSECEKIGNVTHKYSRDELLLICREFTACDIVVDNQDRYAGRHWYLVNCRK